MTAIVLYISHIVFFFFLGKKYGADLIEGLKGSNNKWDAPEIITGLWIIVFIMAFLANLFLDYEISSHQWYSMDLILITALGGRAGLEYLKKRNDRN